MRPDRARISVIAAGVVLGFVAFEVISSFVKALLAPLIATFIGDSLLELNAFKIGATEFPYGFFLQALLIAAVAALVASLIFPDLPRELRRIRTPQRHCPECTSTVSVDARRCPYCMSALAAEG